MSEIKLTILGEEHSRLALEEHAPGAGLPWALVKKQVFSFVEYLRSMGVFLVEAEDNDTITHVQDVIFVDQKNYVLGASILGGDVNILTRLEARKLVNFHGQNFLKTSWGMAEESVLGFVDYLYGHNVFFCACDPACGIVVRSKTVGKKVLFLRLNTGSSPAN